MEIQGGSMVGFIISSNDVWTDKEKVQTTWTDAGVTGLQGGSMVGFIISSNGVWEDKTKVTTTWTDI